MKYSRRKLLQVGATLASAGALSLATAKAPYPSKAITVIVPFAAGGATDLLARVVTRGMEKKLGQPFIIENAGGAGATLGTGKVASAAADGYTLLLGGSSPLVMAPHLYKNLKYEPFQSFEPIARFASAPYVLVTNSNSKLQTFEELITFAQKNPNRLNYGSPGEGSALHLTIVLMLQQSKMQATHIPFRGSAPAWNALLAGDIDFLIDTPSGAMPMLESGKVVPLAVTSAQRLPQLQQVKTLRELGLHEFESEAWFAMLAPKDIPTPALAALRKAAAEVIAEPETRKALEQNRFTPANPNEPPLAEIIRHEYDKWGAIIKANGIQPQ